MTRRRPTEDAEMRRARRALKVVLGAALLGLLIPTANVASAQAEPLPHWIVVSQPAPAEFHPGDSVDFYELFVLNDGAAASGPFTVTDTLPAGLIPSALPAGCGQAAAGAVVTVTCSFEGLESGAQVPIHITVSVPADASGTLVNEAVVSGGDAPEAATATNSTPVTPTSQPVPFGAEAATGLTSAAGLGTAAGSHPFAFSTLLAFNVGSVNPYEGCGGPSCANPNTQAKDVEVALPPGLIGNPTAVPRCSQAIFERPTFRGCPASTQVGFMELYFYGGTAVQQAPVYNLEPPPGQPAELGFSVATVAHIPILFHLRSDGDYGITADVANINQFAPVRAALLSIWGFPSDPAHDPWRESEFSPHCIFGCPAGVVNPQPFLTLPTACPGTPLPLTFAGDSWQSPLSPPPLLQTLSLAAMTECNKLHFNPSIEARPTTNQADSPSGLHVDLNVPQDNSNPGGGESPEELATAHLKDATVTLPKGLTVNPSSAAGLEGCSPAQIGLRSEEGATPIRFSAEAAQCPNASKLGSVEIDTPLLKEHNEAGEPTGPHPLPGAVYLAKPYDNPFKSLLAIYITVNDPKTGVVVKLAGQVHIAPDGRLTTTVTENPQLPFEDFKLDFFGGARAPLRTPAVCGKYETTSELTPWSAPESGEPAKPSDPYEISSGPGGRPCANSEAAEPNSPSFEAGTESPIAAAYSPFVLHLHREDGSQNFKALNVTLPPGLIGKLAGVGECSDSALATAAAKTGAQEQASPSCPASSRIGTVNVGAGAGPSPFYAGGVAYLAGPYKSAPLSVAIVTPAVAGPFDLGTVVVRSVLHIDPTTAQVSVASDPIPTELQGIQLDIRSVDVKLDRNQFTLNPTNCEKQSFTGQEISTLGQVAPLTNPFQVGECGKLKFKPKLAISLKGGTRRNKNPALKAALTYPKGDYANIARAQVTLPHSEFLDQSHIQTVCTRVQFAAGNGNGAGCPAASIYGHARAITPLLDNPVEGPVYLRSSSHKLPDLVAALGGQISVDLAGKVDTGKGGGIRNTFEVVPDAPVSKFVLSMKGGSKGLLVNSENICKKPQKALAHFVAQNGKVSDTTPLIANSCKTKHKRHGGHH